MVSGRTPVYRRPDMKKLSPDSFNSFNKPIIITFLAMESNFTMYLYNAWLPEWFTKIKNFLFLSDQRQTVAQRQNHGFEILS